MAGESVIPVVIVTLIGVTTFFLVIKYPIYYFGRINGLIIKRFFLINILSILFFLSIVCVILELVMLNIMKPSRLFIFIFPLWNLSTDIILLNRYRKACTKKDLNIYMSIYFIVNLIIIVLSILLAIS